MDRRGFKEALDILGGNVKDQYKVVCQDWDESERGWGIRPDGWSLHLSEEGCKQYIDAYWSRMPDRTPDEYSRPGSKPVWAYVTKDIYDAIKGDGIRVSQYLGSLKRTKTGERYWKLHDKYKDHFQPAADTPKFEALPPWEKKPQDSVKLLKVEIKPHPQAVADGLKAAADARAAIIHDDGPEPEGDDEPKFYDPFEY
jgi:hypothetical protein